MPTNKQLEKSIKELTQRVDELECQFKGLVEKKENSEQIKEELKEIEGGAMPVSSKPPIAPEYRELVDSILNKKFGLNVEYTPTEIVFTIIVPDEYSALTPSEKEMMHQDLRTKRISYALGLNGAKEWCEKVYNSFTTEYKAKILQEKNQ